MATITWGKYSGKEVEEIFESDRNYCEWIFQKYQSQGSFKDIAPRIGEYLRQETRLETAEWAQKRGRLTAHDLAAMQNGDLMTKSQGQRFMALVEAAVEAGIIELED